MGMGYTNPQKLKKIFKSSPGNTVPLYIAQVSRIIDHAHGVINPLKSFLKIFLIKH